MTESHKRLPVNFHQTFIPEKRYISSLLRYAADNQQGTMQDMALSTNIPMGNSSGKMPAIFNYSQGMGLIDVDGDGKSAIKRPVLTTLGRTVLLEDPNLTEELTQWIAHFNLCRSCCGAEIWFLTFAQAYDTLGMTFLKDDLDTFLNRVIGKKTNKSLIGPLLTMYEEPASFQSSQILSVSENMIKRSPSPVLEGFITSYCAIFLSLFETHFPNARQVTISDFEDRTFWKRISGWNSQQHELVLEMLQRRGAVDIDRQMQPWIITRKSDSNSFWRKIYDDLV